MTTPSPRRQAELRLLVGFCLLLASVVSFAQRSGKPNAPRAGPEHRIPGWILADVESLPGSHSVSLSWVASVSQVVGYDVYRGSKSGGPYSKINSLVNTTTSYTDTNVTGGITYYYVVTSVNASGEQSNFSNQATAVIP